MSLVFSTTPHTKMGEKGSYDGGELFLLALRGGVRQGADLPHLARDRGARHLKRDRVQPQEGKTRQVAKQNWPGPEKKGH